MKRIAKIILCVMFALPMLVGGGAMLFTNGNLDINNLNTTTNIQTINPKDTEVIGQEIDPPSKDYPQPSVDPIDPKQPTQDPVDPQEPSEDPDIIEPAVDFDDSVFTTVMWKDNASEGFAGGTGTKEDPYQISTAQELAYFSKKNNEIYNYSKDKHFVLTNDISLNDGYFEEDGTYHDGGDGFLYQWTKIGANSRYFRAVFDGKGFTISGVYINETGPHAGFFGLAASSAKIANLNIENAHIRSTSANTGGFVGATFDNLSITNCSFEGSVYAEGVNVGGILGFNSKNITVNISNCVNYGKIYGLNDRVGGIVGGVDGECIIENCINYGEVSSATESVGGIVGSGGTIKHCKNYGTIIGYRSGGIAGQCLNISYCENYGNIRGTCIGGIVGLAGVARIANCKNYGMIETSNGASGMIVGTATGGFISNCENYGNGTGTIRFGGIIGYSSKPIIVNLCKNYGNLNIRNGGTIAGELASGSEISYCENYGSISIAAYQGKQIITAYHNLANIYDCISIGKVGNVIKKVAIVHDYKNFSIDPKTCKISLSKSSAIGSFLGRMNKDKFINEGFSVIEVN